jgi:murein DD-endopeptidase MepM/ murein hydrolase activator NlpD
LLKLLQSFYRYQAIYLLWVTLACSLLEAKSARVNLADGFDFPVGKPDAVGYYKARGLRLKSPRHLGEDWNGKAGGDSDKGHPIYTIGNGIVTWAYDAKRAWGKVVIVRHAFRDPSTKKILFCDSLYGHLDRIDVKVGQQLKRGQQVGTLGDNNGRYPAHLHFEIMWNLNIGVMSSAFPSDSSNWADPTQFINRYRKLNSEWGSVAVPTQTYQEYQGFKGL